jgi:hypothetical protein
MLGTDNAVTAHTSVVECRQGVRAAVFDREVLIAKTANGYVSAVYHESGEVFILDTLSGCDGSKDLFRHLEKLRKKRGGF